eukprot:Seg4075.2 transcript_id=Seg4075.2/GoldUCD/mRNA.D3Y31 product="hypothetical protein" protein_id=Seg4075.2/GoldUCD/D3Y31
MGGSTGKLKVAEKHRQWNGARKSGKESDWPRFKSLPKQQKQVCRSSYNSYVSNMLAQELKAKPKEFWQFIKSKEHDTVGVSPIRAANGFTYTDDKAKTNILNATFQSIFNIEANQHVPDLGPNMIPSISNIGIEKRES